MSFLLLLLNYCLLSFHKFDFDVLLVVDLFLFILLGVP
jgi:hypothetical protein